ncbi:hypothetical protein BLJAPNOD_00838 [Ensifer sp. M14]|uniref:hypothetical protein n=1 Tax=Ensifer sp. M14 TaxID=2203782 RepID=UPI000E1CD774|nr:hypothetical protein [Ensifer sp. M14]RDL49730.1 hypothetical protein BLJAPNOD_00838 [Ensifer sp. M14]
MLAFGSVVIATPVNAASPYDLRHGAQLLQERFKTLYFEGAETGAERSVAGQKALIHVLMQAHFANTTCEFKLDSERLWSEARRLGEEGSFKEDFSADIREAVAETTGDEMEADFAGTCSDTMALYEAAAPLVEVELARTASISETHDPVFDEDAVVSMAILSGTCERLVVVGKSFSEHCDGRIVQVTYASGRAGFTIAIGGEGTAATFSGMEGVKPDAHTQTQSLDKVTFNLGIEGVPPDPAAVVGNCVYGNPYKGSATISCQGIDADNAAYLLQFRSDGSPPSVTDFRRVAAKEALPSSNSDSEPPTRQMVEGNTTSVAQTNTQPSINHPDSATVPIAYSIGTVLAPLKINPTISTTRPMIDVERMVSESRFAEQKFPDFACPEGSVVCPMNIGAEVKVFKSYVVGNYQPTERWCREVEMNASIKGTAQFASGLQMQMLQATLIANNVQPGTEEISFNPYGFYLYRALMAAEVCLGLRQ